MKPRRRLTAISLRSGNSYHNKEIISMSIISTSLTVRGQSSPRHGYLSGTVKWTIYLYDSKQLQIVLSSQLYAWLKRNVFQRLKSYF